MDLSFPGVRSVTKFGTPWLIRVDLNSVLGLHPNTFPKDFREEEQIIVGGSEVPVKTGQSRSRGGGHSTKFKCITPGAAYRLAMRSDKPEAVKLQRWLSEEVIPSIRDHGIYVEGQEAVRDDPAALDALVNERALSLIAAAIDAKIAERSRLDREIEVLARVKLIA